LQKRSMHVRLAPGRWDHSAAGHVDEGESYEQAAERELEEELGISGEKLEEIAHYKTNGSFEGGKLNRFNKLYRVRVKSDSEVKPDPHEVSGVGWFSLGDIKRLIAECPGAVTEGLVQVIREYYP
jgi:isopentenyldiphosphate isomerase